MKKLIVLCLSICLCMGLLPQQIHAQDDKTKQEPAQNAQDLAPSAKAAYLVENTTGKVIYAKHETDKLYPASMTKMMGLLLIFEALHDKKISWDESVSCKYGRQSGVSGAWRIHECARYGEIHLYRQCKRCHGGNGGKSRRQQ